MTRKTTRDAALSRLFGREVRPEVGRSGQDRPIDDASVDSPKAQSGSHEHDPEEERTAQESPPNALKSDANSSTSTSQKEATVENPTDRGEAEETRSGYIGLGRYAREDGILERITPYVRPDQAEALRVAVARKRDPRGRDISRIIQSLLDEAGYCESSDGREE